MKLDFKKASMPNSHFNYLVQSYPPLVIMTGTIGLPVGLPRCHYTTGAVLIGPTAMIYPREGRNLNPRRTMFFGNMADETTPQPPFPAPLVRG